MAANELFSLITLEYVPSNLASFRKVNYLLVMNTAKSLRNIPKYYNRIEPATST